MRRGAASRHRARDRRPAPARRPSGSARPSRSPGIVRAGKNPYATVPNASRSQWLSVKPEQQIGTARAPGSLSATKDSTALHRRRVQRRARSAVRLEELQVVLDVAAEHRADHRLHPGRMLARQEPAVDDHLAHGRDHVPLLRGGDHRRRKRQREQRLHQLGDGRVHAARPLEHGSRRRHARRAPRAGTPRPPAAAAARDGTRRGARSAAPPSRARCRRSPASTHAPSGRARGAGTARSSSRRWRRRRRRRPRARGGRRRLR